MKCPICNKEIKDDSKFCEKCGKKIPRCPTCGNVINKRIRFCTHDGTRMPEEILSLFPTAQEEKSLFNEKNIVEKETVKSKKKSPLVPMLIGFIIILMIAIIAAASYILLNSETSLTTDPITTSSSLEGEGEADEKTVDRSDTEEDEAESEIETTESTEETGNDLLQNEEVEEVVKESNETASISEESEDPVSYFIMHCDSEMFSKEDLETFDADMCRIARNGIYARMGRKFEDEALRLYFEQYEWYNPTIDADDFSEDVLNDYQIANRDLIVEYEEEQGYR